MSKPNEGSMELKKRIKAILLLWGLPTRRVAINELVQLALSEREAGRRENIEAVREAVEGLRMTMDSAHETHSVTGAAYTIGVNGVIDDVLAIINKLREGSEKH